MRFSKYLVITASLFLAAPHFMACKQRGAARAAKVKDIGPDGNVEFQRMKLTIGGSFGEGYANPDTPTEPSIKQEQTWDFLRDETGNVKEIRIVEELIGGDPKQRGAKANQPLAFVADMKAPHRQEYVAELRSAGFEVRPIENSFSKMRSPDSLGQLSFKTKEGGPSYAFEFKTTSNNGIKLGNVTYSGFKLGSNRNGPRNFILSVAQQGTNEFLTTTDHIASEEVKGPWYEVEEYQREKVAERSKAAEKITISPNDLAGSDVPKSFAEFSDKQISLAKEAEAIRFGREYIELEGRSQGFGTMGPDARERFEELQKKIKKIETEFRNKEHFEKAVETIRRENLRRSGR